MLCGFEVAFSITLSLTWMDSQKLSLGLAEALRVVPPSLSQQGEAQASWPQIHSKFFPRDLTLLLRF